MPLAHPRVSEDTDVDEEVTLGYGSAEVLSGADTAATERSGSRYPVAVLWLPSPDTPSGWTGHAVWTPRPTRPQPLGFVVPIPAAGTGTGTGRVTGKRGH